MKVTIENIPKIIDKKIKDAERYKKYNSNKKVYTWTKNNLEHRKEYMREWRKNRSRTVEGIYKFMVDGAKQRKLEYCSKEEFFLWFLLQKYECTYCGNEGKEKRLGIDRMNSSKGYLIDNITFCCLRCNMVKSNLVNFNAMKYVGQLLIMQDRGLL